jgi:acetate kinase
MNILVPNLGSTSLKYQVLSMPEESVLARGRFERVSNYEDAIAQIRSGETRIDAVAFKAVIAGQRYRGTFVIDEELMEAMERFRGIAPVHNTIYINAIRAFQKAMPGVPLVAAFEPEFHRTMPEYARVYGVPREWKDEHDVVRYGYHGASHEFISGRAAEFLGKRREDLRTISCHLGGSSSLCAIDKGRSVDTTFGFSPQSGLENATRHGELDAFAVLYMMERNGWTTEEVRQQLARESGLAGLSGVAGGDVRDIEEAVAKGSGAAKVALQVFAYQVKKTIGSYIAVMGGVDAIAFTGGIGENSSTLRKMSLEGLEFFGIELDAERNENGKGDRLLSKDSARVAILALGTNEEIVVARRAYRAMNAKG